jgi:hypothetical protein
MFDERLIAAKALIDKCIHKWIEGSRVEIAALIEHAFQTDKEGNINTGRVLGLMRLNIDDEDWKNAMEAIKDSIVICDSISYLRIYEKVGKKHQQIVLDMAAL